jgi:hypothetical protein
MEQNRLFTVAGETYPFYVIANSHLDAANKFCMFVGNLQLEQEEIKDAIVHKFWAKETNRNNIKIRVTVVEKDLIV